MIIKKYFAVYYTDKTLNNDGVVLCFCLFLLPLYLNMKTSYIVATDSQICRYNIQKRKTACYVCVFYLSYIKGFHQAGLFFLLVFHI